MSYYCYLHGWASPVESCPKCVTVTTSTTTDIPDAEFYRRELESAYERVSYRDEEITELKTKAYALQAQVDTLTAALEVIASNGEGRGMGWTPAQHARQALAEYESKDSR